MSDCPIRDLITCSGENKSILSRCRKKSACCKFEKNSRRVKGIEERIVGMCLPSPGFHFFPFSFLRAVFCEKAIQPFNIECRPTTPGAPLIYDKQNDPLLSKSAVWLRRLGSLMALLQ